MKRIRILTTVSLAVLVPLGFTLKHYPGPGHVWVNDSLAGALYVIFWILVGLWLFPRARAGKIAMIVLAVTGVLEFLQLADLPPLVAMRSHYLGRTLVGSTFVASDFLYYAIGAALGWIWAARLQKSG